MKTSRMFFLIVFCATAASASSEMSYTNWPSVTPWKDLTNHIAWCYSALSERLAIVNRSSETNDILPSYTWPVSDYLRFAEKIDSIAPLFADQTKDQNDHFKLYLTTAIIQGAQYSYPEEIPRWSVTNLHKRAFSQEHWSTNSPLHSWVGMTNHVIQVEVQNAITTLVWTAVESTSCDDNKYYRCSQFGKTKIEPCYCDGESYPAGYTNSAASAKTLEQNRWDGGQLVDGYMGWGNPIYAVGTILWITKANYNSEKIYTSYGARTFAKPVLYGVCTSFVARASVFLVMRHYKFICYESYKNYWYTWDYKASWLNNKNVQTNHVVFSEEFDPPRASKFVGDYPFYDKSSVNPVTESGNMTSATEQTSDHIYCDTADWLLKWNVPGGLSMKPPPPIGTGAKVFENQDVDRDDLVEIAADMRSLGTDSGSITLVPECDAPVTLIPLAATPAWFGSLPVHAYFSQGAFTNLPYQVHVDPHADDDGYYTAYSLNTRIEESNAINTPKVCQKLVELVRPRGNAVIFEFKWEEEAFSDKGFPIGVNKNRSYVLRDMTPETHDDKQYELYFASGIVHEFDVSGSLAAVRHADGRRVAVTSQAFPSATILRGQGEDGPGLANDLRYGVTITWDRGTVKKVEYKTKRSPEETITTEVGLDDQKKIKSLKKTGCGGVFSKSDAAISGTSVTYGSGVKVTRNATAAAGTARTVTLETSLPNVGKSTMITEFNVSDKVVRTELSGAGERAVTRYEYVGIATETRYPNGFPKQAKLKQIKHANGAKETFEYSTQEGWLITRTLPSGTGFNRVTAYSYDNFKVGDAANPTNVVERPRKVEEKIGTTVIGRTLFSYSGAGQTVAQVCENASAAWNDPKNLKTTQNFGAGELTAGLPVSLLKPIAADNSSYNYEPLAGKLKNTATYGDGRVVTTVLNAFGASESSDVKENGQTVSSSSSTVDSFGRPLKTSFLDRTEVVNSEYGLYGPASVKGSDGSISTFQYFDHGALKQTVNNSTAITTTYEYDPLGHTIKTTIAGGGKTSKTEATYDSLGRMTSSKDALGGTTRYGYMKTSSGVTQTTTPPSGGSIVEERCFDGSVKQVYGSAAPASLRYDYGIENSSYYVTVTNVERPSEYTTTYYNFLGNPARTKRSGTVGETVYRYDSFGRPIGSSDEEQISRVKTYNSKNQLEHSGADFNRDGQANLAGSDDLATQTRAVSPAGVKYQTTTYQTTGDATATSLSSTETSFDGKSGSFSQFGRCGSFSRSNYAPLGTYSVTSQNSDGTTTASEYEKWRLVSEQTTGANATTRMTEYEYDGLGRLERVKSYRNGIAQATTYVRDSKGRITSVTQPDPTMGIQSVTYFGNTERISRIVKADGTSIAYFYDGAGRLTREFDMGAYDKHYDYDNMGRMTRLTTYGGGTPQITEWQYNAVTGLLNNKTIGGVTVATYNYKDNGQVSSVTDANNVVSTIGYDNAGGMTGITASDGSAISSVLGRTGRAESLASAGGPSLAYSNFTADDIPLTETISGNSVINNAVVTRAYASTTHNGILAFNSVVAGGLTNGYSVLYASAARVASITSSPVSATCATYLYCGDMPLATTLFVRVAGRLLTKTVQWDYSNARPLSVAYSLSGIGGLASYNYQYAPNSDRISKVTLADSTARTYAYDSKGQLLASESFLADGVTPIPGMQWGWAYDGIGNVIKAGPTDDAGIPRYSFTCDDRNVHISRAWGSTFEIAGTAVADATVKVNDAIAQRLGERFFAVVTVDNEVSALRTNIVVTAFRHDPLLDKDIVACVTGVLFVAKAAETPAYDNNASLVTDSRFTYSWDAFGRLTGAVNDVVPKTRLAFAYYPDGRRARKTVYRLSGQNWLPVRNYQFFYDGWNLASEIVDAYDATGNLLPSARVVRRCLWGLDLAGQRSGSLGQEAGGIGGLLAFTVTSNNVEKVYLPIADAMGNIHKVVDATTGAVAAEFDYDPFGKPIAEAFPNSRIPEFAHFSCPFRFQSKYYDAETGLYYFGYRYYDPASCKWLCRDPLQEQGGINLTAYCSNDPVNKVDPLGLALYAFDGTCNHPNEFNLNGTRNYKTNVRLLYEMYRGRNSFYAYGIGSGYNADGTLTGSGVTYEAATGASMEERATWMMLNLISQLKDEDKVVDVIGFSRGTATATFFLNWIQERIASGDELFQGITIRFVALFDQVPSKLNATRTIGSAALNAYVTINSLGIRGYNPYERLSDQSGDCKFTLPKEMRSANILHLVALDEQRREFAVTDLQGALQVGFRGVHSNVGGGYEKDFFAYITRRFVYERAKDAGLSFNEKMWAESSANFAALYDCYDRKMAPFPCLWEPTDNSELKWDDNEPRKLPKGLLLHKSVKWFSSKPKNPIKGYDYLP